MKHFFLLSFACLTPLAQAQTTSGYTFIDLGLLSENAGRALKDDASTLLAGGTVNYNNLGGVFGSDSGLGGVSLAVSVLNAADITFSEDFAIAQSTTLTGSPVTGSLITLWANPGQTATISYTFSHPTSIILPLDVGLVTGGEIDFRERNDFGQPDPSRGFLFNPPTNPGLSVTSNGVINRSNGVISSNTAGPTWLGRSLIGGTWQTQVTNFNGDSNGPTVGANQFLYATPAPEPSSLLLLALGSLGLLRRKR